MHAAAVFGRTSASTGDALWIIAMWVRLQDGINLDLVATFIAKVVNVKEIVAKIKIKEFEF